MSYGLPERGELDWDTKLDASIESVKGTADDAAASISAHAANTSNPHNVTKAQVGLSNVDNTSDLNKPISTAVQEALDLKADLGAVGLELGETSSTAYRGDRGKTAYDHSQVVSGNPHGTTKSDLSLGNVDNTSDANKPVSTATQTALDAKSDKAKSINSQTGTSYTLVIGDADKWIELSNAGAITLTVPPNGDVAFAVGTQIEGMQTGAGQVTITPGSGVTINAAPGLKIAEQYGGFGLIKVATNTWRAYGRLSA